MDPARRWQVASVVTAAASIGVGAFALQRPSSADVAPIDLDVIASQPAGKVGPPTLPLSADAVIVTPDLLERMPTAPSPTSTVSPVTVASVASTASPAEPSSRSGPAADPTSAVSPVSVVTPASAASPDEPAASRPEGTPAATPPGRADEPESADDPDTADTPASVDSSDD